MNWVKSCAAAFRFLTIIRLPSTFGDDAEDLEASVIFFPLVGSVLGLAAAAAAWLLWQLFPPFAASSMLVVLLFSFSGALHLDGLADTADGFFSSRPREMILEIMRDSRIGVMGVAALFAVLLLKVSSLSAMDGSKALKAAFIIPLAGRCTMVVMMRLLPYVRSQGGLGTRFYARINGLPAYLGVTVLLLLCFVVYGYAGLALAGLVLAVLLLFSLFCFRKIGGATGDTLGAACEIAETTVAVICATSLLS